MPVRKIPRNRRSLTGIVAAGDGERGIAFESTLERDFITLFRFDPAVAEIEEQPVEIPYTAPTGRATKYTPDFLVRYASPGRSPGLFEVKYRAELEEKLEELRPRFEAAEAYAAERGWMFRVVTEDDLRRGRLKNARFLLPFRRDPIDHGRSARILRMLEERGPMPVARLLEETWPDPDERAFGMRCLWQLLSRHLVTADLDIELSDGSVVWLPGGEAVR